MAPTTGQPTDVQDVTDVTSVTEPTPTLASPEAPAEKRAVEKSVAPAEVVAPKDVAVPAAPEEVAAAVSEAPGSSTIQKIARPITRTTISRPAVMDTGRRRVGGSGEGSRGNARGMQSRGHQGQGRTSRLNLNNNSMNEDAHAPRPSDGPAKDIKGFVDVSQDGHAVIREGFSQSRNDVYLSIAMVRKLGIRPGDVVEGTAREPRENDRYWGLKDLTLINGKPLSEARNRRRFEDLIPVYPKEKFVLETGKEPISTRLIDLVAPIGKGQRGLIVSPPKAGKTTIMKEISTGIAANFPGIHLMAVLIGERPEEVTDIARHISSITDGRGETAASNFDEPAVEQTRVAEVALERAKRLVELGQDVVIVMDSITRLARAYNLAIPTSGRTLSGGFDPAALYPPKRFFGAARNFEEGGSLTIIATALVDTGSRMDDLVYEEFKGTGNMELHLDRRIAERRIYPAINVQRSGTRRDDLLFSNEDYQNVVMMHRMLDMLDEDDRTAMVVRRLKETNNNKQFLASLKS
jgi:transcription termination factor Rho